MSSPPFVVTQAAYVVDVQSPIRCRPPRIVSGRRVPLLFPQCLLTIFRVADVKSSPYFVLEIVVDDVYPPFAHVVHILCGRRVVMVLLRTSNPPPYVIFDF